MKYYYEEQLSALLVEHGFVIKAEFGHYDGRLLQERAELIFV